MRVETGEGGAARKNTRVSGYRREVERLDVLPGPYKIFDALFARQLRDVNSQNTVGRMKLALLIVTGRQNRKCLIERCTWLRLGW